MARILVVEDDKPLGEVLGHALADHGFRYEHAANGRVGLEKMCEATAARDPFDCVLLDIIMPEVDGWQFLQAVKSNPLWVRTRVVILTGYAASDADIARASAYDCVHVTKKGRFVEAVGEMVERMLSPVP